VKKKSTTYTETELVTLLKSNDKHAFEYLYDNYAPALYGIICKIVKDQDDASDVMQDAFLKIWRCIGLYNSDKGTLFTWILNIARNTAIDRHRMNLKFANDLELGDVAEVELARTLVVNQQEATIDLRNFIDRLVPEKKLLIDVVYFQGYTHEEASEYLGIPLGTVKSRIRSALQEMKRVFELPKSKLAFA